MRLLALAETSNHVCARYRIRAFQPALLTAGWSLTVEGIATGLIDRLRQIDRVGAYDAVLLQRKLLPRWQIGLLRKRARTLLFDFDDAVLYRDSYDRRGPLCPRRAARFRTTIQAADIVIAGNDFLAESAKQFGARAERIRIVPTCIDTTKYPIAAHPIAGAGLELAWIGSSSTLAGLERQSELWKDIARGVAGVRLRLICDRFPKFDFMPIVPVPWSEATESDELAKAGVGVSWIPDDLWSRGKCGLKILQYMAAGLPAVANPVGVHTEMIRPDVTGYLPRTSHEWVDAVRSLYDDAARRREMGLEARRRVESDYSVAAWSSTFVGIVSGRSAVARSQGRSIRESNSVARVRTEPREHGFDARR